MVKVCKFCNKEKPEEEFCKYKNSRGIYKYGTKCLECERFDRRERQRRYKERHREKINERSREQKRIKYHLDPEFRQKLNDRCKKYYEDNREDILVKRYLEYHSKD